MLDELKSLEVWFVTGSQHLYGPKTLQQVDADSKAITEGLNASGNIPVKVVFKPVVKTPDEITQVCVEASAEKNCIGIITWMHTFSPAKMWIAGLSRLTKPMLHLHTQFGRDIPWSEIDMDYMNLNQSAHGGREFGHIVSRLRKNRKVVVGHWQNDAVQKKVGQWARVALAWYDSQGMKVARIGDNMREVAVTEGDKVEAQIRLGWQVHGYGIGDVLKHIDAVTEAQINALMEEYHTLYEIKVAKNDPLYANVRYQAKLELGMHAFLKEGGFKAYTDTFENLYGMEQLPGLASQRLMAKGYGFGGEGDWKHSALVRAIKVMGHGLEGGCSFMEDYTYHFDPANTAVLGSHMLEICPSIASGKPSLEVHALGIGGKAAPARLVFNAPAGPAINASLVDMGNRFRMIVNSVDVIEPLADLPKLPVARTLWKPQPSLDVAAAAWIYAGGAHHTAYSQAVDAEYVEDFCEIADIEYIHIGNDTTVSEFKKDLRHNEVYYMLNKALR